jgi:type IV secretory pathway VirB2 component (pilin)
MTPTIALAFYTNFFVEDGFTYREGDRKTVHSLKVDGKEADFVFFKEDGSLKINYYKYTSGKDTFVLEVPSTNIDSAKISKTTGDNQFPNEGVAVGVNKDISATTQPSGNPSTAPKITGPRVQTTTTDKPVEQIALDIIMTVIFPLIGAIALIFVIYGGIMIIMSQGDPEKLTKAKRTLLWAVIGIIIVVLSYGIVVTLSKLIKGLF